MGQEDLAGLTVGALLDLAIRAEEEAAQRYGEFVRHMEEQHNAQAAALFRQIQTQETAHVQQLRKQRSRLTAEPTNLEPVRFFDPAEATTYEGSQSKMTTARIYEIVLQGEERASAFYQKLSEILHDPEARELARSLWKEELGHVEWVARQLRNLPPESSQAPS